MFGNTKTKEKTSPLVNLAINIKLQKTIMTKARVTPQVTGPMSRMSFQLENQINYPLADYKKIIKKCRNINP